MLPTGPLEELATRFVLPAKSGVYLTRNELIVLARVSDASLRINERKRMLADVLKSAQSPAELTTLLRRLIDFCQLHVEAFEDLGRQFPCAAPLAAPWITAARDTMRRLEDVCEELAMAPGA